MQELFETKKLKITDIKFREDLYPRIEHNQQRAQDYAKNLEKLPPIEINQYNELIDGKHRLTAHLLNELEEIDCIITETKNEAEFFALAIRRNALHGVSFNERDRRKSAIKLYNGGIGFSKIEISEILSVSMRMINSYLGDIDKQIREDRKETIRKLYLRCHTAQEIADVVGLSKEAIEAETRLYVELEAGSKNTQTAHFQDNFKPPIYNIWSYGKTTNETEHHGQTEQQIVENLIYLYTDPFDIVVDPFGGGGSTLDVCEKRQRRCWISDRKPKAGLEDKIRLLDITKASDNFPKLNNRWSEVSLTYLDPPYWKQAENKYSSDPEDLANYPDSNDFHIAIAKIINGIAKKQSKGAIALIIQPTQWKSENKKFIDHVFEITKLIKAKNLILENRVSCPYSTEQYLPQMVSWAKENKKLLVLTRELIIWRFHDCSIA